LKLDGVRTNVIADRPKHYNPAPIRPAKKGQNLAPVHANLCFGLIRSQFF